MQHSLNAAVNRETLSQYVLDTLNAAVVRESVGQYSLNTLNATIISPVRLGTIQFQYSQCHSHQPNKTRDNTVPILSIPLSPERGLRTIQSQYSQCLCHQKEDSGQYSLILSMPVIRERTQDNTVSILSMPLSSERGHRYRMVMIIPWWVRRFWRQNMLRKALRNPVLRKQ